MSKVARSTVVRNGRWRRSMVMLGLMAGLASAYAGCGGGGGKPRPSWFDPDVSSTWHVQLQGDVSVEHDVLIYDLDLFDTPESVFTALRAADRKIICYFSAGTFEDWREDAAQFDLADLGEPLEDFPNERWLDIRSSKLIPIMRARLDLAKQRGCDGVDPDNVDGYANNSGFPLKASDQLKYNRMIAREAHKRKLAVGLKNDLDQVADLARSFDFAVNEQCHEYEECDLLLPFIKLGKPVVNIEYADTFRDAQGFAALCRDAELKQFRTMVLPLDLDDSSRMVCGETAP